MDGDRDGVRPPERAGSLPPVCGGFVTPPLTIHRGFWRRRSPGEVLDFIQGHTGWRPTSERLEAAFGGEHPMDVIHLVPDGEDGYRLRAGVGWSDAS